MLRRHRSIPEPLRLAHLAFTAQAERIAQARRALLSCLPVGRVDPVPVPVGLDLLRDELDAVNDALGDWRTPEVEGAWQSCRRALEESRAAIVAAKRVAVTTAELDELLAAVAEVVDPLNAWGEAERDWQRLRRRPGATTL